MAKMIDADALYNFLEMVRQQYREENTLSSGFAAAVIKTVQDEYMAKMPTVEVVRCKDCKHWRDSWVAPDGKHTHGECHLEDADDVIVGRWGDDFCSYGERKQNEN